MQGGIRLILLLGASDCVSHRGLVPSPRPTQVACPLSSEFGTNKTVRTRFWPWLHWVPRMDHCLVLPRRKSHKTRKCRGVTSILKGVPSPLGLRPHDTASRSRCRARCRANRFPRINVVLYSIIDCSRAGTPTFVSPRTRRFGKCHPFFRFREISILTFVKCHPFVKIQKSTQSCPLTGSNRCAFLWSSLTARAQGASKPPPLTPRDVSSKVTHVVKSQPSRVEPSDVTGGEHVLFSWRAFRPLLGPRSENRSYRTNLVT